MKKQQSRVQIEDVQPKINGGRYPVKRIIGDTLEVSADIFVDGNNELSAVLLYKKENSKKWSEIEMEYIDNDRWGAEFEVNETGFWKYTICAWVDHFKSWQRDLAKRIEAGQDIEIDLLIGLGLIKKAYKKAGLKDKKKLNAFIKIIKNKKDSKKAGKTALQDELSVLMDRYSDRTNAVLYDKELSLMVDPKIAGFGAWYELFPRSFGKNENVHGTFKDVIKMLPYVSGMGFDVLYLPPIHPVGNKFRKGKNNCVVCMDGEVGSPWAIGNKTGGHKSIHQELGTLKDFRNLVSKAEKSGLKIALDIAYQCSPDHPYVKKHPEWFIKRPDGSIQYAENPPKKYQDIYPINFESKNWQKLWEELKSVIVFWIKQGVTIFRVDNPHTKDLSFWEWMITEIKQKYPDTVFLAEAFTRPKLLYRLAKLGFTQSYNYFPWRNTKQEITEFFTEITSDEISQFFRANIWSNTPDILTGYLQNGGDNAFKIRFVLSAMLGTNYGIYGPAFELCENTPFEQGSEEYLNSEKYEIKNWDINSPKSLSPLITKVNQIRKDNICLQSDNNLEFFPVDNDNIICFGKYNDDLSNIIVTIVNLDPNNTQLGQVNFPHERFGLSGFGQYKVCDLLDNNITYQWNAGANFVELDPYKMPAHVLSLI